MLDGTGEWGVGGEGGSREGMCLGVAAGSAANDVTLQGRYSTHVVISNP